MFKNYRFPYSIGLFLALSGFSFAQDPVSINDKGAVGRESAKITLVIARPSTSSKSDLQELSWVPAFAHEFLLFRLGVINQIRIVDPDTVAEQLRGFASYKETPPPKQAYLSFAKKMNATHVLFPEFQSDKSNKTLRFSLTAISVSDETNSLRGESVAGIDKADACLDSSISQLLKAWEIQPEDYAARFFRQPITGSGKCDKAAGNALMAASSSKEPNHKKIADDLKKCSGQDPQAFLMYYVAALEFAKANDYEDAGLILKDLIYKLGPVYPSLYPRAARYFRLCEKFEDGLQMVKLCEGLNLQSGNLAEEKAMLLEGLEDWDKAQQAYQDVLSSDPGNYRALLFLMKKSNKDKEFDKALKYADAFLQNYPSDGPAFLEKSKALVALNRFEEAQMPLTRAVVLLSGNPEPDVLLGDLYAKKNDNAMAVQCYTKALAVSPENVDIHIKIARAYMLLNNPREALAGLKKIEKKFYDNPEVQKGIGMAEYQLGDTAAAKRDLNRCVQSGQPDISVCLTLGTLYYKSAEYNKSLEMYQQALKLDPGNAIAERSIQTVKGKMQGTGGEKNMVAGQSQGETSGGISAVTVIRIIAGAMCVGAVAGGYFFNSKISGLQTDYSNSHSTSTVNSLHTDLANHQLYRNILYGVGGLSGIGFGVTFAIPSR
jgi:tetratricopeptide (TPR) repeat protein